MKVELSLEDIEPNHWIAWANAWLGCFSSGRTPEEAIGRMPDRIADYFDWLAEEELPIPNITKPFETIVAEVFTLRADNCPSSATILQANLLFGRQPPPHRRPRSRRRLNLELAAEGGDAGLHGLEAETAARLGPGPFGLG